MTNPTKSEDMKDFLFPGINLAITKPFDANGKLDNARLEALIERYLAARASAASC